jgi:hypothetical protein
MHRKTRVNLAIFCALACAIPFSFGVMSPISGGSITNLFLNDLSDVNTAGKTDGQVLTWNSTVLEWIAANTSGASTPTLQEVTDEGATTDNVVTLENGFIIGDDYGTPKMTGDRQTSFSRVILTPSAGNYPMSFFITPSGTDNRAVFQVNNKNDNDNRGRLLIGIYGDDAFIRTDTLGSGVEPTSLYIGESESTAADQKLQTITFGFDNEAAFMTLTDATNTAHFNGNNITGAPNLCYANGTGCPPSGGGSNAVYNVTVIADDDTFESSGEGDLDYINGTNIASWSGVGDGDTLFNEYLTCDTMYYMENTISDPAWLSYSSIFYDWLILKKVNGTTISGFFSEYPSTQIWQSARQDQITNSYGSTYAKLYFAVPCLWENGIDIEIQIQQVSEG